MTRVLTLGNRDAGDDAAGPLVGDALRAAGVPVVETADVVSLAEALLDDGPTIVVDAAGGPGPAGTVHRLQERAVASVRHASSHGLGLREALALARAQGGSPEVTVFAIVGRDFRPGARVTPEVERAIRAVVDEIRGAIVGEVGPCA